ncbi:hypothetical protein C0Q70_20287 [Pomacea canaliculata]|uniref:Uncharacterized protein n=1 Tax=Pomacea canaliculata TaxID=400727 RepID=A0A2T7NF57_POMCA|nr:hypothetical protein C0Q70_20287 [Pomacea canaliculata]
MLQSAAAPTSCLCVPASRKAAVNLTTSRADLARQVPATRGKGSRADSNKRRKATQLTVTLLSSSYDPALSAGNLYCYHPQ